MILSIEIVNDLSCDCSRDNSFTPIEAIGVTLLDLIIESEIGRKTIQKKTGLALPEG